MNREVVCESVTQSVGTDFGLVGGIKPGLGFHAIFQRIDGSPGIEAISTTDPFGWTVVAIGDKNGEFARLRGRNWFFDPLAETQILLPNRPGVRVQANGLVLLLSLLEKRVRVPEPFDRTVRFRKRIGGMSARWAACEDETLDGILMVLVAFRFWLESRRPEE